MKHPIAKICPRELVAHGDVRVDNYYWLNERENPEVIDYLKQENIYQEAMMKDTEPLQQQLYDGRWSDCRPESRFSPAG